MWRLIPILLLISAQDPAPALPDELRKLIATIDVFDPHSVKDLPFVRASEGMTFQDRKGRLYTCPTYGFLVRDEQGRFTVRRWDLTWRTFFRSPAGTPEHRRVDYRKVDFKEHVQGVLLGKKEPEEADYELEQFPGVHEGLGSISILTLVRACLQRGLVAEGLAFWNRIEDPDELEETMGAAMEERVLRAWAEPSLSREQILELHLKWIKIFGEADATRALEMKPRVEQLEKLIEEDKRWKAAPKPANRQEEINALVRSLRDEVWPVPTGEVPGVWYQHGVSADAPSPAKGTTISEQLVALGLEAAPALIAALGDARPTRFLLYNDDDFGVGFEFESVGHRANRILQEISGFDSIGREDDLKSYWENWRRGVAEMGEEAYLAEIASSGGDQAYFAAHRLLKRYPKRYPDALAGARKTRSWHVRSNILHWLKPIREVEVTQFFLESLNDDSYRLQAAHALLDRGRNEGISAVMQHWQERLKDDSEFQKYDNETERDRGRRVDSWSEIPRFLLQSGDGEAVRLLLDDLLLKPALVRRAIFEAFNYCTLNSLLDRASPERRPAHSRLIEEGLFKCLEDRELAGEGRFKRLSDAAGDLLSEYWPERYSFDSSQPLRAREGALNKIRNEWRVRQGLKPLDAPPAREFKSKNPEIDKRLDRIVAAEDVEARSREIEALMKEGVGALPRIQERLKKLGERHEALADLTHLAGRLANLVVVTRLDTGAWKASPDLAKLVKALEGRSLDDEAVVLLALEAMKFLPEGCGTVEVFLDRLGDGSGIDLEVRARPGPRVTTLRARGSAAVRSPRRLNESETWAGPWNEHDSVGHFDEARNLLRRALSVPHDRGMEAVLTVHCE